LDRAADVGIGDSGFSQGLERPCPPAWLPLATQGLGPFL